MIPVAGWAATGAKVTIRTVEVTSKARTAERALEMGTRVLGKGYKEIAPGVFRSADGLKQFRMTNSDIIPTHKLNGNFTPHVHFEFYSPSNLNVPYRNYQVPLKKP
ncbi:MAG: hypothetical protein BGO33_08745 [Bacteroidia bacterium 43-41]|nr:MAG: hypothetical protein BGO33_08745 [Bacteroidia bacterium 43-41]